MTTDNQWYKDAVFYQIYPRAFADGNGNGRGDLRGLIAKLDYLQDLGVDCLWIMPIYDSPLKDDGYDVRDFYKVHSDHGTVADFAELIAAAHARGIRVIADLIMNHTSDQHPWFVEARQSPESPKRDYYVWSDSLDKYAGTRIIFLDDEDSNWAYDEVSGQYYWHRFYSYQPDLNYDNPEVYAEMEKVLKFWLDMGIDGFRADAIPYLIEREGTNNENLPETHAILKRVRAFMDQNYEGKILLAEANQPPEEVRAYFGDNDEFHLCFHFPVMPRIFMALKKEDRTSIVDIIRATPAIPATGQWCTFLRCHDELTLEMVTPEERAWMWQQYAPEPRMKQNLGIRRRLAPLLDNDQRKIEVANSILFTLIGSPIIYYGDEIGMGDNIWLPDRNGLRTPMQWDTSKNAGFSTANKLYTPVIDEGEFSYQKVNVAAARANPASLYHTMKKMIEAHKRHRAFGRGSCEFVLSENRAVLSYVREYESERILVINNLSETTQTATLDLAAYADATPRDVLSGVALPTIGAGAYTMELEPYRYWWLILSTKGERILKYE